MLSFLNMLVAVTGAFGKSSLIERIKTGGFSLNYVPTYFTEIHKITMGLKPVILVETKDVIKCDLALLLCKEQQDVVHVWKPWCQASVLSPVIVRVGESLDPEPMWLCHDMHTVSNLSEDGIAQLIYCIYIKSSLLNK
jgi:hypothetical protein|tara:strand:+ start:2001 stop:2414 length:414 start_codon:yes stop_codon:yes gene_type:complete